MRSAEIIERINALPKLRVRLMEVCGTHTMAIARAGLKRLLPEGVELVSGPGCPVCVTPPELMDAALELASRPGVTVASYGDMLRVPGSRRGDDLAHRRARGGSVELVYSPMDAVELAKRHPEREVVFLGVGFETTAPGTAASILAAREQGVRNYSVFPMLRLVEPALRALIGSEGFDVQGFLCPGHVAVITGAEHFRFLPVEYGLPAVVAGFEPEDILLSVYELLRMLADGKPGLVNEYSRAVSAIDAPPGLRPRPGLLARAGRDRVERPRPRAGAFGLRRREKARHRDRQSGPAHGLPLRRGNNGPDAPGGLPALWKSVYAGGPRRALHGVLGGRLRRGVQVSGVLKWTTS